MTSRKRALYWWVTRNKVQLYISPFMHELIRSIHKKYPNQEWSGIAKLEPQDGWYTLTDIVFWEQNNSWTLTSITEKWAEEILEKIFKKDKRNMGKRICWLHSHHHMETFWSGTDEEMKQQLDDGNRTHFFHIVTNCKWDVVWYKWALTIYQPYNIEFDANVTVLEWEMTYTEEQTHALKALDIEMNDELAVFNMDWIVDRQSSSLQTIASIVGWDSDDVKNEVIEILRSGAERAKDIIASKYNTKKNEAIFWSYINDLVSCVNKQKPTTYQYNQSPLIKYDQDGRGDTPWRFNGEEDTFEDNEATYFLQRLKLYDDEEIRERLCDLVWEEMSLSKRPDNRIHCNGKQYMPRDLAIKLVDAWFISYDDF